MKKENIQQEDIMGYRNTEETVPVDQIIYADGTVAHDSADSGNPVKIGGKATSSLPTAVTANDRVNAYFDLYGRQHVVVDESAGGGSVGGGASVYYARVAGSTADAVAAYVGATSLSVIGLPYTFVASDIVSIRQIPNAGGAGAQDTVFTDRADFTISGTTITVANSTFAATDVFEVVLLGPDKMRDSATDSQRVAEIASIADRFLPESFVDTTNVAAAATYYPSSLGALMDGYKNISVDWGHIDADAVATTLSIQATNDEDLTNGYWSNIQFQVQSMESATVAIPTITGTVAGVTGVTIVPGSIATLLTSAIAQTVKIKIDCDNCNYNAIRVVLTPGDASNTEIIKIRRSY